MKAAMDDQKTEPGPAGETTMRAIVQETYGASPEYVLRLAQIEKPVIGDRHVLVQVAAASVDQGTWHVMTGMPYIMRIMGFGFRRPKQSNPGRSLAGTVETVGKDVTEFKSGDEVYGTCEGSLAEFALAHADHLALKPANLSFEQSAAAPVSGVTALQAVRDGAHVSAGQKVLVIGASGGVGSFAVQIAKAFGAEVTGVCSTSKVDLVRDLGADHVVDYQLDDFADGVRRYDVIIDNGGNGRLSHLRRALTAEGRLVIVGGETGGRWIGGFDRQLRALMLSPLVSQKLGMLGATENSEDLSVLRDLFESGEVTPAIDRTYPLSDSAAAIQYLHEGHARGKVVITL